MINKTNSYKVLKTLMEDNSVYSNADDLTLQILADTIDLYKQLRKAMVDQELVFSALTATGEKVIKMNPGVKTLLEVNDRIRLLLVELQLTNKSRKSTDPSAKNPHQAIMDFLETDD